MEEFALAIIATSFRFHISKLVVLNLSIEKSSASEQNDSTSTPLTDRVVYFVGKLGGFNRKEAKKVVKEQGGICIEQIDESVDLIVLGADELPFSNELEFLPESIRQRAGEGKVEILEESAFWQRLGLIDQSLIESEEIRRLYTPAMLAEILGVSVRTIRRWHRAGLIKPVREVLRLPYFDFLEVSSARKLAQMVAAGMSPTTIESKLQRLADLVPGVHRPLAQLSIIIEGKELLVRKDDELQEPGGQLRIDFDSMDEAKVESSSEIEPLEVIEIPTLKFPSLDTSSNSEGQQTPEELMRWAASLENVGDLDGAIEVYRSRLFSYGPDAETNFQLAEILYRLGQVAAARERYFAAIELDESFVEARANLGCVLAELDQPDLAIAAFLGALEHHPDYSDVHFHLARTYDRVGFYTDARNHWERFVSLAPNSPWAEEAKLRLELE